VLGFHSTNASGIEQPIAFSTVIDGEQGDDPCDRPNQVLSISLTYPILNEERWNPVMKVVQEKLLTPVGLRSLSPGHPDYKSKYFGDLRSRDAAYHQGTVWAWLIGPFIDAWLKLYPGKLAKPRPFLNGFIPHLSEGCIGSISEIFDAETPYMQRGCIAQCLERRGGPPLFCSNRNKDRAPLRPQPIRMEQNGGRLAVKN
jgi:glycogen debranching enzyme